MSLKHAFGACLSMLALRARHVAAICSAGKQVDPPAQTRLGLTAVTHIPVAGTLCPASKQVNPQAPMGWGSQQLHTSLLQAP